MRLGKQPKKSRSTVYAGDHEGAKPQHISSTTVIGQVSLDLITTVYEPLIKETAVQMMEEYAVQLADYEELNEGGASKVNTDGTTMGIENPPPEPIFSSPRVLNDLLETLHETSDYFFPADHKSGGYKIYANAAKFERMLDEKYGVFRPFITNHPELERTIRNVQRKYAMGYFSPIAKELPIPRSTAIMIVFMMQRGGMQWQILVLSSLLLIVGLQPWALVGLVTVFHSLVQKRRVRAIGTMSDKIPQVDSYYSETSVADIANREQRKQDALMTPVGQPISVTTDLDTSRYDTIIIGHGPGPLFAGSLLSRAGRKVLMLSPRDDASGCLELENSTKSCFKGIPFDVEANNVPKVTKLQNILAPALSTKTDCQGGIRFAQIGTELDGFAFEVLSIPGVGTDRPDQSIPFVLKASGVTSLMNDAASFLGDGWPDLDGGIGNSTVGAYLSACETINETASAFYVSKIIPENVSSLRSDSQFHETAIRHTAPFLNKCFPANVHTRSLLAGIGMKGENIKPNATSMAAHVSNVCAASSGEGMHYPIGGPRALCKGLTNVIERSGGRILTGIVVKELIFEADESNETSNATTTEDGLPAPRCLGVKLHDGREILFDVRRYEDESKASPAIISCIGLIDTFIRLMDEDTRSKHKVPRGLPALSERRPVFKVLFALKGTAEELDITGADFYRLPSASTAKDRLDEAGELTFGEIGGHDDGDDDTERVDSPIEEVINKDDAAEEVERYGIRKKGRRVKFQAGESWIHIAFPSAKDPSFASRHGDVTTCVVTIEADDDFVTAFDTKPKLFLLNKETAASPAEKKRLLDRVTRDVLDTYPQLEGFIEHSEVRGPYQRGLSHNPERYAAKGVRPETPYPQLYIGGSDLTVGESFAGEVVSGWLVANQVVGYSALDHMFLQKNLTTDLEQFLDLPESLDEEDLAVPTVHAAS